MYMKAREEKQKNKHKINSNTALGFNISRSIFHVHGLKY